MPMRKKMIKTIGIAGSLCRMGTTTQAIQIVKYLKLMGYQAGYIEMNRNEYIKVLTNLYCEAKKINNHVSYEDIELYEQEKLSAAYGQDYDYLVKDYGSITSETFESVSFMEQNIKIIVCGAKPNEILSVERVLENPLFHDAGCIFSFVPKEDRAAIRGMMEERGQNTFFADYVPDPYVYLSNANTMCKALLGL